MISRIQRIVFLIKQIFSNKDSEPYGEFENLYKTYHRERSSPEILYLGDSVIERIAHDDSDRRTLGDMVVDAARDIAKVRVISHSAYHPAIYEALLQTLSILNNRPKLVVLPINLRCFSPQWDLNPEWQFTEEINLLRDFVSKVPNTIPRKPRRTISRDMLNDFENLKVNYPLSSLNKIGHFRLIVNSSPASDVQRTFRLQQIFIYHYMFPLKSNHRKLLALTRILRLLRRLGIKHLLYFTPINYLAGQRFVGEHFREAIKEQTALISDALKPLVNSDVTIRDYSLSFDDAKFFHNDIANEHINDVGRIELAKRIIADVKAVL